MTPINDNAKEPAVSDLLLLAHQAALIGEKIDSGKGSLADIDEVIKLQYEIEVLEAQLEEKVRPKKSVKKHSFKLIKGGKI